MADKKAKVGILMGSDSDLEVMREAEKRLDSFGIGYETRIMICCGAHSQRQISGAPYSR